MFVDWIAKKKRFVFKPNSFLSDRNPLYKGPTTKKENYPQPLQNLHLKNGKISSEKVFFFILQLSERIPPWTALLSGSSKLLGFI